MAQPSVTSQPELHPLVSKQLEMQRAMKSRRRQRLSLSLRVSVLLVFAAILPLLVAVAISEFLTRPALVAQANLAMESDAKTRVQLIDTYLTERLLDTETLSQVPSVQAFLATPPTLETKDLITHATYALAAGQFRDKSYTTWSLFDPKGRLRLYYPLTNTPQPHGHSLVPPEDLQAATSGKVFVSAVYFDPKTNKASVDLYAPIATASPQMFLGFIRATLTIDYIWNIVKSNRGANGDGSYAFILDQNGVRIADTEPSRLFSAIAPLPRWTQQIISNEARYGNRPTVPVLVDRTLASMQQSANAPTTFQMTPAGQHETFQVTKRATAIVPWTYVVLSPLNTVTAVANQQLVITSLIAVSVLVLAALIGVIVGQRITNPLLRSVDALRSNTKVLNTLASRQKGAASEQKWVVDSFLDSSQMGLQSMQFYSYAAKGALRRLSAIVTELMYRWHYLDESTVREELSKIIATTHYLEQVISSQETSKQKLATAIRVMTQVNEQLVTGATSATDAATQLEEVVNQLRDVVGK